MQGATYIVIALSFALASGIIGRMKGSSFLLWFVIGGLVPVIGLIVALAYRYEIDEPRRSCPRCGRVVKLHDALCLNCGQELDYTDDVIPPESALHES